jgi:hypothetical protein
VNINPQKTRIVHVRHGFAAVTYHQSNSGSQEVFDSDESCKSLLALCSFGMPRYGSRTPRAAEGKELRYPVHVN